MMRRTRQQTRRAVTANLSSALICAVGDSDMHWHDIDDAIGARHGTSLRYVMALVDNRTRDLGRASDIVFALGGDLRVRVVPAESGAA